jgi:predicted DsbA family dithiol-disulfide isomerase
MAQEFSQVKAEVIEANEFPELSRRYGVSGVPKTIINDRVEFVGAVPEAQFVAAIKQAVPSTEEGSAPA